MEGSVVTDLDGLDLDGLDRKDLLALRRRINRRLEDLADDEHGAVVAAMNLPPGWGANDGNDGDDE